MPRTGLHKSRATGLRYVVTAIRDGVVYFHRFGGNVSSDLAVDGFMRRFSRIDP